MTYEARILAVLHEHELTTQTAVIRQARMAPAIAIGVLAGLVDERQIERLVARPIGRGRPAYLYRKRVADRAEAA